MPSRAMIAAIAAVMVLHAQDAQADDVIQGDDGDYFLSIERLPEFRYLDAIAALDRAGYRIVSVTDTWLNRVRIRAASDHHLREIVISRSTGAVLRDALVEEYR